MTTNKSNNTVSNSTMYSIKDFCNKFGYSDVYIRRYILNGKITATKVEIAKNTYKWMIDSTEAARFTTKANSRTRRDDGRTKFNLYATSAEFEALKELIEKKGAIVSKPVNKKVAAK